MYELKSNYYYTPYIITQTIIIIASTFIPYATNNNKVNYIIYPAIALEVQITKYAKLFPARPITALISMVLVPCIPQTSLRSVISIGGYALMYIQLQKLSTTSPHKQ